MFTYTHKLGQTPDEIAEEYGLDIQDVNKIIDNLSKEIDVEINKELGEK